MKKNTCWNCGKVYDKVSKPMRFCSDKCEKQYIRKSIVDKKYRVLTCPICDKSFKEFFVRRKYCSEACSMEAQLRRVKAFYNAKTKPKEITQDIFTYIPKVIPEVFEYRTKTTGKKCLGCFKLLTGKAKKTNFCSPECRKFYYDHKAY